MVRRMEGVQSKLGQTDFGCDHSFGHAAHKIQEYWALKATPARRARRPWPITG
jgi:hypothetical protein